MSQSFKDLGLSEPLCRAVAEEGYSAPSPIQAAAIPAVLAGKDVLGCAQTGTGKTAAFALPILDALVRKKHSTKAIRALILTPTRELAIQIQDNFKTYGRFTGLSSCVIFGGVGDGPQKSVLRNKPDIVIATPGRFLDLKSQGFIDLKNLEVFVLDEADRMLDMGFIHDVKKIVAMLPKEKQSLLFSATIPKDVETLIHALLKNPVKIEVNAVSSTNDQIAQTLYFVDRPNKRFLLDHLIKKDNICKALVFTRTKHGANKVAQFLTSQDIKSEAIHSNRSQNARQRALENFRKGAIKVLVASDIASRGIDIDDITHVFNYDIPNIPETYVHRIGRTGRAAAHGIAVSFCDSEERAFIRDIERLIKQKIPVIEHPFSSSMNEEKRPIQRPQHNRPQGQRPNHSSQQRRGPRPDNRRRRD
jgi:ATP-dependent RNA helicase RhlE